MCTHSQRRAREALEDFRSILCRDTGPGNEVTDGLRSVLATADLARIVHVGPVEKTFPDRHPSVMVELILLVRGARPYNSAAVDALLTSIDQIVGKHGLTIFV